MNICKPSTLTPVPQGFSSGCKQFLTSICTGRPWRWAEPTNYRVFSAAVTLCDLENRVLLDSGSAPYLDQPSGLLYKWPSQHSLPDLILCCHDQFSGLGRTSRLRQRFYPNDYLYPQIVSASSSIVITTLHPSVESVPVTVGRRIHDKIRTR